MDWSSDCREGGFSWATADGFAYEGFSGGAGSRIFSRAVRRRAGTNHAGFGEVAQCDAGLTSSLAIPHQYGLAPYALMREAESV